MLTSRGHCIRVTLRGTLGISIRLTLRAATLLGILATLTHAAPRVEFNRDVRPILADKCWHCHGPDAAAKNVPLRLDSEAAARKAIVPGHPEQSPAIARITTTAKAKRMPPVWSNLSLTEREIETLRAWIGQGAEWQAHWSFLPPARPNPPSVNNAAWVRNPIDAFVLERLEREGLAPRQEAAKETLLRRVSLDLTGLPPTPAEIDAFLQDASPTAYENVVDRLLASPRYAERMAARWLDAARYADTNGYQYDGERDMWRWRDWVIESFRRNEPYDRFVTEQLAGDLLPGATMEQKIATGFNRNHRINTEDGIIPAEYSVEYVVDRVETTSTVFMGLTLGCARCHNHKYDPLTQKEFYQFFAYFNNVPELGRGMKYGNSPPVVPAPTAEQQHELAALDGKVASIRETLDKEAGRLARLQRNWERKWRGGEWVPPAAQDWFATPVDGGAIGTAGRLGGAWRFEGKGYLRAAPGVGQFDIKDAFSVSLWVNPSELNGMLAGRMVDKPKGKGYGIHLRDGKVHVNITSNYDDDAIRLETGQTVTAGTWRHVAVTYDGSAGAKGIHVYLDGRPTPVKVLLDTLYRPFRNAGSVFKEQFTVGRHFQGELEGVRLWPRVLSHEEIEGLALGATVTSIAKKAPAARSAAERRVLRECFLEFAPAKDVRVLQAELNQALEERRRLMKSFPTVMVMAESEPRRPTHLLRRGAYDQPGEIVEPGLPSVLPPLPEGVPNNRMGLAQWLTGKQNPLLARVTVNRFWQMYFGTGLVKTVEDFGSQGEWPSHPELLDWLATEFMGRDWDVKAMQKLIVTSATYRQSSRETKELAQRDPDNRLLARGPRLRLPAEMVRDQALLASGLLTEKAGGPSVKPYQPEGLWGDISMQDMDYVQSHGPDLYRRSLYTFWKRTIAPPMMMNFDAAHRESCVVRDSRTNTPLQALNLMNDVTFLEAARMIGQRMIKEGGEKPEARLRYGFRLVTARYPKPAEEQVLFESYRYHKDRFSDPAKAEAFLKQGEAPIDPAIDRRELACWGAVASLILNLDEALVKE